MAQSGMAGLARRIFGDLFPLRRRPLPEQFGENFHETAAAHLLFPGNEYSGVLPGLYPFAGAHPGTRILADEYVNVPHGNEFRVFRFVVKF
jgi:hypothetical protein